MQQQTIRKLERRRELIRLRERGLNNREIARELGSTERAVATVFYRAKKDGMTVPRNPYWKRKAVPPLVG